MKIKFKYTAIIFSAVALLGTGCNEWLDVRPQDQVSDEQLFEDAEGFRSALNGIYQKASDEHLYGRAFTWGFNSFIAQEYAITGSSTVLQQIQQITEFNYTDYRVTPVISNIWSNAYNTIANCNKLISEIETRDPELFLLGETEKNLILGETIAMRGLLHFELLRLFAPAPTRDMSGSYMPYQDSYPVHYIPPRPTSEILDCIIADLSRATGLVAEHDTIVSPTSLSNYYNRVTGSNWNDNEGGVFFTFRLNRLNLVAIHGLLARVYLYAGDRTNAKREAEFVYSYGPDGGTSWWTFTTQANSQGANRYTKLADDLILALYDRELITKIGTYVTYNTLYLTDVVYNWLPTDVRDYRANLVDADRTSAKWIESTSTASSVPQQNYLLPVLRMSEMYYILSECLYEEGDVDRALQVLNQVRQGRGRTDTFADSDREAYYIELLTEYRREYLVEGQTVFAHKRLNRPMVVGTRTFDMSNANFVLPIPEGETIF